MNGTAQLPIFDLKDGSRFLPTYHVPVNQTPWDGWTDEEIVAWALDRWTRAVEAKKPENARLTNNVQFYDGRHYNEAWMNREYPIENRVYEIVETLVANAIIAKPRPEIVPLRTMDSDRSNRLREVSEWYMDQSEWDFAEELRTRDKKTYGYGISIITFDYRTGMPYPKPWSVFDYYPDPSGVRDDDRTFWFLGSPRATDRLKSMYHALADKIVPDNLASPSYNAVDRGWYEFLDGGLDYDHPAVADSALAVHRESEPTPTESTTLATAPADRRDHGETTFLLQMIVRDDALVDAEYWGTQQMPDGTQIAGMKCVVSAFAPRSESGFWILNFTARGLLLERPKPLDDCYLGLPWVVDMEEQRTDCAWSRSPVDHAIPIQREIDDSNYYLRISLQKSANPPLKTTDGKLDAQLQTRAVEAGDTLLIQQGREADYMEFPSPAAQHFARLTEQRGAMRDIAGVQAALEGARPPGIEAAAALRHLDTAAQRRLRAKENPASRARALLLRKCLYAMGKKLQPEIAFMATNGKPSTVTSDDLSDLFHIRFAEGSGTVEGRVEREDKALALYDRELIDEKAVLDEVQWPDAEAIAIRMAERKAAVAIEAAAVGAASGGGNRSRPPKGA